MEAGQILIATSDNDASWSDIGKTLLYANQTSLPSSFTQANNTNEQEVTALRVTLPVINKTCTLKATFGGYAAFGSGNNNLRIRIGTNTTYLSNTEYQNLYCGTGLTVPTMVGSTIISIDLSTETYVVISMQNDAGNGGTLSAFNNRTSVMVEVYG